MSNEYTLDDLLSYYDTPDYNFNYSMDTAPITQDELASFYGGNTSDLYGPMIVEPSWYDVNTAPITQDELENFYKSDLYDSGIYADKLPEGSVVNPLFDQTRTDSPFFTTAGSTYIRNPQGKYVGWVGDDGSANYYDQIPGYVDPDSLEAWWKRTVGNVQSAGKKLLERPIQSGGKTIKRNPDGSITITDEEKRLPSALEQIMKSIGLGYQLTKENPKTASARPSVVQAIGPQAVAARPVSSTVMRAKDGGKVELPEQVKGGLLPLTMKIAELLMAQQQGEEAPRHKGLIGGEESGQEDNVEALLSPGEYVIDAEIVSALGDGNTDAGAKKLDEMRYNIRKHKRSGGLAQIAPKAKSPEKYMKG